MLPDKSTSDHAKAIMRAHKCDGKRTNHGDPCGRCWEDKRSSDPVEPFMAALDEVRAERDRYKVALDDCALTEEEGVCRPCVERQRQWEPWEELMEGKSKRQLADLVVDYRDVLQRIAWQSPYTPDDWARIGRECVEIAKEALASA